MNYRHVLGIVVSGLLAACAPPSSETSQESATAAHLSEALEATTAQADIVLGKIDTINSSILEEDRDLWIYLPRSAEEPDNTQIFPVVYLLDGNGHFRSVSGMVYQLSTVNGNKKVPEMIVVGIPNTDRMRDLTPTHTEGTTGGGAAFLDFVENEVIPHVEANYPASQYRTFVGHSLGGLMAIEALITRPEVFANYVAIDPSLWWDEQSVMHRAEAALNEMDFTGKSLFVSVANTMPRGMSIEEVVTDEQERTTHIRSILQFSRAAEADSRSGLNFDWAYYGDDSHGSVPLISEYEAFRFFFPWYDPLDDVIEFLDPKNPDSPELVVGGITEHYTDVSQRLGYENVPPLNWVNGLGRSFLFNEKPESALAVFQLNLSNYPESPTTHEALGDYFLGQRNEESARLHFQHAIERGAEFDIEEKFAEQTEEQ